MGKRLPKAELLEEIERERQRLNALLSQLKPRQMTRAGATLADWSVKDILAHVVGWQQLNLRWYSAGLAGEPPEVPAPGRTWRDVGKLNDDLYRRFRRRSLASVLADYEDYHQRMLKLIEDVPDDDLVAVGRFNWTGPSWTLSDYVRANTASHYRWASKHVRKWMKTLQQNES